MSLTMAGTITVQSSFSQYFVNRQVRVSLHVQFFFAEHLPASAIYVHDLQVLSVHIPMLHVW